MTRSLKIALLRTVVIVTIWSCAMPAGELSASGDAAHGAQALTAGDHGLELMLPFPAGANRTLTRAYMGDISDCVPPEGEQRKTSHCTYASGLWDDRYALDFAGVGCESWRAPVLAAAEGRVVIPPDSGGRRSRSYGEAEISIDHGDGCVSHYAHLDERIVTQGQMVQQGEQIGFEGNRGNVSGSACPDHPGTHLHFKVVCDGVAVRPEPISGYTDMGMHVGRRFVHRAFHHPVGTLVKTRNDPRIYQVCGPDELCHVRDERVWRSRRFFQDSRDEWAAVITVSEDEIACHDRGPDISNEARFAATTCGSQAFVTFDGDGTQWRRRIPFDPSQAGFRILLKSWGFRMDEVLREDSSCSIPVDPARELLTLRDGSVIEQASDNDFFVIADDGIAYRLYRNLTGVLYGTSWPQVIQVPTGSVPLLVRSVSHSHPEFTITDATSCPNGRVTLEPSSGGAVGGGTDGIIEPTQNETMAEPPELAEVLDEPVQNTAGCQAEPRVDPPINTGGSGAGVVQMPVAGEAGTISCVASGGIFAVTITGPMTGLVVGNAPPDPVAIKFGSDKHGWTDYSYSYDSPKDQVHWGGEADTYVISVPADAGRFNFYLYGFGGEVGWFDLPDADGDGDSWRIIGACRMVCDAESCALSF